ncbi:HTH domain-containing protein [Coprococcus sp. AM27-12LB]|nr:HTH domain-containing protein [Coprococcus sp. AM27-12LB]
MKESRLFRILYYLLQHKKATAPELAEEFEVSVRTIYRDIDYISSAGVPIYATQILHIETYDDEPISFQKMDLLAKENDLVRSTNYHREIYLNNANRVLKSKLKTILRYCVK